MFPHTSFQRSMVCTQGDNCCRQCGLKIRLVAKRLERRQIWPGDAPGLSQAQPPPCAMVISYAL